MILNSIWATKYEELVMENADLHLRLHQLNDKFSAELFQAQHIVGLCCLFLSLSVCLCLHVSSYLPFYLSVSFSLCLCL